MTQPIKQHEIREVALLDLKPAAYNPRVMTDEERAGLDASLERWGLVDLIVWNEVTGRVVGGHQRLHKLLRAGMETTKVVVVHLEDEAEEKALNIALNNPAITGQFQGLDVVLADVKTHLTPIQFGLLRFDSIDDRLDFGPDGLPSDGWDGDGEPPSERGQNGDSPTLPASHGDGEEDRIPPKPREVTSKLGDDIKIGRHRVICGDCIEVMRTLADNSIDAVISDPPYGLSPDGVARTWDDIAAMRAAGESGAKKGFMGKEWDAGVPGKEWAAECLRILKPGGYLCAASATRTVHRLACAVEDVGFELQDQVAWITYQGFPKSKDLSKALDEVHGMERHPELVPTKPTNHPDQAGPVGLGASGMTDVAKPVSDDAKRFEGVGTSLKPSYEPFVLAQKPLDTMLPGEASMLLGGSRHAWSRRLLDTEKKRDEAVEKWEVEIPVGCVQWSGRSLIEGEHGVMEWRDGDDKLITSTQGRPYSGARMSTYALNVLKWGTGGMNIDEARIAYGDKAWPGPGEKPPAVTQGVTGRGATGEAIFGGGKGLHTEPSKFVVPDRGRWPANIYHTPKPHRTEKEEGCDDLDHHDAGEVTGGRAEGSAGLNSPRAGAGRYSGARNTHATIKPVRLMRWLLKLLCPKGGIVLEPFAGSGTTLVAAAGVDCSVIGIEREPEYVDIIKARVGHSTETE